MERIAGRRGEHHAGELRRESAQAKAEGIITEELQQLGWTQTDLEQRSKSDPEKLALTARLRRETTLTIKVIANRSHLGSWKSAATRLQIRKRGQNDHAQVRLL